MAADLSLPHVAVSLHFKRFHAHPGFVWHQAERRWYSADDFDTSVLLYADRVRGWFLECVRQVEHNGGFIILMVAISYLEGNERYRRGDTSTTAVGEMIKSALRRLFPSIDDAAAASFYKDVRCGLFHDGMTRASVVISSQQSDALLAQGGMLSVNPQRFLERVMADLDQYVTDLKDQSKEALRNNFSKVFVPTRSLSST
jgi:hypothetical protein